MYVIKNSKRNNFYKSTLKYGFHFVLDLDEATKIRYKKDANKILNKMKKLRDIEFIEIVKL